MGVVIFAVWLLSSYSRSSVHTEAKPA
jgi:hypothetical protein